MKKKKRRLRAVTEVLAQAMAERDDLAYRLAHAEQDANGARAALAAATRGAAKMAAERDEAQRQVAEVLEVLDLACTRTARAPDGSPRTPAQRVRLLVEQLQQPADALEMLRLEALRRQRDEARRSHEEAVRQNHARGQALETLSQEITGCHQIIDKAGIFTASSRPLHQRVEHIAAILATVRGVVFDGSELPTQRIAAMQRLLKHDGVEDPTARPAPIVQAAP